MDVGDNSSVKNSDNAGISSAVSSQMQSQQQLQQNQKSPLLHAWYDPLSNLKTSSTCIRLADLACDGYNRRNKPFFILESYYLFYE